MKEPAHHTTQRGAARSATAGGPRQTTGDLYRVIEDGFRRLAACHGEAKLFIGPPAEQATARFFTFPELIAVTDLASALQAAAQRQVASGAFVGYIAYSSVVARSAGTDMMTGGRR